MSEVEVTIEQEVVETVVTSPFINYVTVNGADYEVKPLHAKKVARIANLFATSMIKGNKKLKEMKAPDTTNIALGVLASLDENDLVKLASVLIDVDEKFADDNFDLLWVTDALGKQIAISNLKGVVENFTALLSQIQ